MGVSCENKANAWLMSKRTLQLTLVAVACSYFSFLLINSKLNFLLITDSRRRPESESKSGRTRSRESVSVLGLSCAPLAAGWRLPDLLQCLHKIGSLWAQLPAPAPAVWFAGCCLLFCSLTFKLCSSILCTFLFWGNRKMPPEQHFCSARLSRDVSPGGKQLKKQNNNKNLTVKNMLYLQLMQSERLLHLVGQLA